MSGIRVKSLLLPEMHLVLPYENDGSISIAVVLIFCSELRSVFLVTVMHGVFTLFAVIQSEKISSLHRF